MYFERVWYVVYNYRERKLFRNKKVHVGGLYEFGKSLNSKEYTVSGYTHFIGR